MSSAAQIRKSGLWMTSSFALIRGMQFLAQIVLARLLTREDFGVWSMVLIVTTLSTLFKDSALANVLVQRGLEDKKLVNAVYSLTINISIGMFLLQAAAGYPLSRYFAEPILFPLIACAALVFLIGAGAGSHGAILSRQMQFRKLAIAELGAGLARNTVTIVGAVLGYGVWAFVAGEIAMELVGSSLKRWYSGYRFTYHLQPDDTAVRAVRSYISSMLGINLAVYANTSSDNFIIGKVLGSNVLGGYNLAYQLAMLPNFALSQLNRVNFSVLSQRDRPGQQIYMVRLLKLYAFLAAPLYGVLFLAAPWGIPLVYGTKWMDAVPLFQIILIFAYARGFMAIMGTALNALNKPNLNAAINWVLVPLAIPTFILGARWAGAIGVAWGVALLLGVGATIWFWLATCRVGQWPLLSLLQAVWLPSVIVPILVAVIVSLQFPLYLQPPLLIIAALGLSYLIAPQDMASLTAQFTHRFSPEKVNR
jgi:lipopolysaccharide exporter